MVIQCIKNKRLRNKSLMLVLISSWFNYKIPIGSRRILRLPTVGSDRRKSSDPTSDNFLSESGLWVSDNFPTGSCRKLSDSDRKLSDYLGFPVGSDGIRRSDCSSWVNMKNIWVLFSIWFYWFYTNPVFFPTVRLVASDRPHSSYLFTTIWFENNLFQKKQD